MKNMEHLHTPPTTTMLKTTLSHTKDTSNFNSNSTPHSSSSSSSTPKRSTPTSFANEPVLRKPKALAMETTSPKLNLTKSAPYISFHDLYTYLSFRFLQMSEKNNDQVNTNHERYPSTPKEDPPRFILEDEYLYRIYTLLFRYLRDPLPFTLSLSNFTSTRSLPLLLDNLQQLTFLPNHPHVFDLHLSAPEYEEVASELTSLDCVDKFKVYVYVSQDHIKLKQWQTCPPHVVARTVGKLPSPLLEPNSSYLDFWERQLILDRQVLYNETKPGDYHMQRQVLHTSKLNAELMDYAIAWNIFGEESKSSSIIIFTNYSEGIQNLVSVLRCRDTWTIQPRTADEFRLLKAWILSYCF